MRFFDPVALPQAIAMRPVGAASEWRRRTAFLEYTLPLTEVDRGDRAPGTGFRPSR